MKEYEDKKKKVLVLGSSGFVGRAIYQRLLKSYEVYGSYYMHEPEDRMHMVYCDVASDSIQSILEEIQPEIIISSLRGSFENQLKFHQLLAEYIRKEKDRKLIFISTANVFDGELTKPHYEMDSVNAQTDYGKYKSECEKMLRENIGEQSIIIRIPAVWGVEFPRVRQLKLSEELDTVTNIYVNVTTDTRIAAYVEEILLHKRYGIFHIGTKDAVDYYEFQKRVCRELKIKAPVFHVETRGETGYQVLYSKREDIPEELSQTVDEVLEELKGTKNTDLVEEETVCLS